MISTYTIKHAYPYLPNSLEIEIVSDGLVYSEAIVKGGMYSGCQTISISKEVNDEIRLKCNQIADLIREIDQLNVKS